MWIDDAGNGDKALWAASLKVNDVLLILYKEETGQEDFKTFHDWKNAGFKVKKGEKSFRVWGRPKMISSKAEGGNENADPQRPYEFFPMCCLFHGGQVEPISLPDKAVDPQLSANDVIL